MAISKADANKRLGHCIAHLERLNGGALGRVTWENLYSFFDDVTEGYPLVGSQVPLSGKFGRARIIESPEFFTQIDQLGYPPTEKCISFGRCNRPKAPMLYAGVGTELLFSEIGARAGDIVGVLHLQPKETLKIFHVGMLDLWRRTSGNCMIHEDLKVTLDQFINDPSNIVFFYIDAFVRDYFSRIGSDDVYKLTSAYTSVVLDSVKELDGIKFDSVDHSAGACLALKPNVFDGKLVASEAQVFRITSYLGYGIYDFEQIKISNNFEGNKVIWQK
jgi:hypothetical protein